MSPHHPPESIADSTQAAGPDLKALVELARLSGSEVLLDVSGGSGHTALVFALHARRVVAVDQDPVTLARARTLAQQHDQGNIEYIEAPIQSLPFADQAFDRVVCRLAAHRWQNLERAAAEMARVLKSGGKLLLVDNYAPDHDLAERFLNTLEQVRTSIHMRFWRLGELSDALVAAGLSQYVAGQFEAPCDFETWVADAGAPGENVALLRGMLSSAPPVYKNLFHIETGPPLRFSYLRAALVADKP